MSDTHERLEYLRGQLRAECISYGELHELQGLAEHIEPGDVELLEAAGVPEHPDDREREAKERATCSACLARTYRGEECVCEDGGDAEDYDVVMFTLGALDDPS